MGSCLQQRKKVQNKRPFRERFYTLTENTIATQYQIRRTTIEYIRLVPICHFKTSQLPTTKTNTKSTFTTAAAFRYFSWPIYCWWMFTYQVFRPKNHRRRKFQQLRPETNWSREMDTVETTGTIIPNNKKQPNPNELPPSCTWLKIAFRSGRRRPSSWLTHSKRPQQQQQPYCLSTMEECARSPGGYLHQTTSLGYGKTNTGINCAPTGKTFTSTTSTV